MLGSTLHRRGAFATALTLAALIAPSMTVAARAAAVVPKAGLVGRAIVLHDHAEFKGYDIATDAAGNAYIGWIANTSPTDAATRQVHLCTLRPTGGSCAGGIQHIDSLGISSAAGLRVLATPTGAVTLVWFHDTDPDSVTGPRGGRIATATSQSGGPLSAATDVADAPSFGQLLDAQFGPGGALWTVAYAGVGTSALEVRPGVASAPVSVPTPYSVGTTRLAFSGSTAVIATTQYGSVSTPISTARSTGGAAWSSFGQVAGTWSVGSVGLATARSGLRLVGAINNASYSPVVARFTGTGFSRPRLIGDRNSCTPYSHDLMADASGRLADVSNECGKITIVNMPDAANAAIVRFSAGGTVASGDPQIAATPRGRAWIAWSIQSTNGNKLLVARALLPARDSSISASIRQGGVTVIGPASCLPAVGATAGVRARPAAGWRVASASLLLNNRPFAGRLLDGSRLRPNTAYSLTGRVLFTRGNARAIGAATLRFRTCANP